MVSLENKRKRQRTLQNTDAASFIFEKIFRKLRPKTPCQVSVKVMTGFDHPKLENQNVSDAKILYRLHRLL